MVQGDDNFLVVCLDENDMKKHQKEYRQFLAEIEREAFKRPLLTHRNGKTTGWKRVGKVSGDNIEARESKLGEDLAKSVSLSLHQSFCLKRVASVKNLSNHAEKIARTEKVDASIRTTEGMGGNCDQDR